MTQLDRFYDVVVLLNSSNKADCENASRLLEEFQKSAEAWSVADKVLSEGRGQVYCLFAAQTLRRKMVADFQQLPLESLQSLRDSIVLHLSQVESKLGSQYHAVSTQLCLALADLYLQVPTWNGFIAELLNQFAGLAQNDVIYAHVLLDLFKVFPEELKNPQLRIGDNRRNAVQSELASQTAPVLICLQQLCASSELQIKAITTLGSWLRNKQCPSEVINQSFFFQSVLDCLMSPDCLNDVHFAAATTISKAMMFCEDLSACADLARTIMEKMFRTELAFDKAVREENVDKLTSYARLYSDLCEMLLEPIVNTPGEGLGDLNSLELVYKAAGSHDYAVCELTFDVWYKLSESLFSLSGYEFEEKCDYFKPVVEKYLLVLVNQCRFESNLDRMPSSTDDFVEFREKAAESAEDVNFILGSLNLAGHVIDVIQGMLRRNASWDEIEAGLFIVKSTIGNVVETDETVMPKLIDVITHVSTINNPIIVQTTVELIGEMSQWLSKRAEETGQCIAWLLGMQLPTFMLKSWADTLQKVTCACFPFLYDRFGQICTVLELVEGLDIAPRDLDSVSQELSKAAANLLNDRPGHEIAQGLATLLTRPLDFLAKICERGVLPDCRYLDRESQHHSKDELFSDPRTWLDRVACIYRVLRPWHLQREFRLMASQTPSDSDLPAPWADHSIRVANQLSQVFSTFAAHHRVMEHCCRAIRFVVRSMACQSAAFIPQLAEQLCVLYREHSHSCFLYMSSVIVDENGQNQTLEHGLTNLLNYLVPQAIAVIMSGGGPIQNPETIDDLYRLAVKACYRMPTALFHSPIVDQLIEKAAEFLEVAHQDANKSAQLFLTESMNLANSQRVPAHFQSTVESARALIRKHGQKIVWHTVHGSIFVLPAQLRYDVANLLKLLNSQFRDESTAWIDKTMTSLPKDSGLTATSEQLQKIRNDLVWNVRTSSISSLLDDLSRLYT